MDSDKYVCTKYGTMSVNPKAIEDNSDCLFGGLLAGSVVVGLLCPVFFIATILIGITWAIVANTAKRYICSSCSSTGTLISVCSPEGAKRAKEAEQMMIEETRQKEEQRSGDAIAQLERIASLKERGLLTDEEFLEQKKKILNNN